MKNVITADLGAMLAERRQLLAELKHRDKLLEETRLAWDMALKASEHLRAEKEKWSAWAKELGEKCDRLEAEAKAIRGQQPVAWKVIGIHPAHQHPHTRLESSANLAEGQAAHWKSRGCTVEVIPLYALPPQQPDAVSVTGVHEFAVEILRGALEGGSFDGGDIQEMGVKYGLLFPEQRTEPCCEFGCNCAEFGFPAECFRIARALLSTKNAEEGE